MCLFFWRTAKFDLYEFLREMRLNLDCEDMHMCREPLQFSRLVHMGKAFVEHDPLAVTVDYYTMSRQP